MNDPSSASPEPVPTRTLSEYASKELLAGYDIAFARESLASDPDEAARAAERIGFPVAIKLCGDQIAHKTERNLVRLGLADAAAARAAAADLLGRARPEDGDVGLLVAEMVGGRRELIAGLVRDPQFGPCVLLGLGGILAEAIQDVVFAAAPIDAGEAKRMLRRLRAHHLLTRPFRGEPAIDEDGLAAVLVGLGRLGLERPDVASVDLNPLIVCEGRPVAVDALVELGAPAPAPELPEPLSDEAVVERFRPLFHPRGIVVAGASSHPGKFGFVTLHNLRRFGYRGEIFPLKPDGAEVLGRPTLTRVDEVPEGAADLVFVCTPNKVNEQLLRDCAARGVRAAFVASAGYGEAGQEGAALQRSLVATADELGMVMIGPNGQGVISTPDSMCAQIVAPYPPAGRIAVASQSGNLVSAFLNYAVATGVGVSKAVSLGNSAQTGLPDLLEYFAADPDTDVAVVYVEGVGDGERFKRAAARLTARKPLVLVKGGVADVGKRAAASHTGALASDDRVFDGIVRQIGALRAPTVEEAFEWAATLATQPRPTGRRTVVFTTVGGWGVLAADACAAEGLELIPLPDDVRERIDTMVPSRWSRNNPVDLAGGETRDTVPEVLDLLCAHPEVDAIVHLGIGIQAGQANAFRTGEFFPDHGLSRIAEFHERQDRRYAEVAAEVSRRHGVPILTATELAVCDRDYGNAGPLGVKEQGRVCYPSAHRAVRALRALVEDAEFRARRSD
ncbi:MAG: acetate--CoA ligase family protein [Myxococcota bacterium]